jgi:putative FmdB family regulatory protein
MPVYEYDCTACGRSFSRFYKSQNAATTPTACPNCGAADLRRALSRFQVHQTLKGKIENLDPKYEKELQWADRFNKQTDPMSRLNLDFNPPSDQ